MKGRPPTQAESTHMDMVQQLGCIVCDIFHGEHTPAEIHHTDGKTKPGAHMKVLPLCDLHHRHGTIRFPSIHSVNGKHGYDEFKKRYTTEEVLLVCVSSRLRCEHVRMRDVRKWEEHLASP